MIFQTYVNKNIGEHCPNDENEEDMESKLKCFLLKNEFKWEGDSYLKTSNLGAKDNYFVPIHNISLLDGEQNNEMNETTNISSISNAPPPAQTTRQIRKNKKRKRSPNIELKKGRRKKDESSGDTKFHSKNRKDNRKNKIKVHFLNFIVDFTNGIIKGKMFDAHNILFRKLPHSAKKDIHIETNKELLNQTIEDVLTGYGVSSKYKNKEEFNKINFERLNKKLQKSEYKQIFEDYLKVTVKDFYLNFYYVDNEQELLDRYQINRDKVKPRIVFLKEFIEKLREQCKNDQDREDYIKNFILECDSFVSDFEEKIPKKSIKKLFDEEQ